MTTEIRTAGDAWQRQRFFVVFKPGAPHWWDWFLKPGFTHVYVLIWDYGLWLYVDPALHHTRVVILEQLDDRPPGFWLVDEEATVLEVQPEVGRPGDLRAPWVLGPLTCVESVKAVLGIRRFWLFTPWQLFKHLRRRANGQGQGTEEDPRGTGAGSRAGSLPQPDGQ